MTCRVFFFFLSLTSCVGVYVVMVLVMRAFVPLSCNNNSEKEKKRQKLDYGWTCHHQQRKSKNTQCKRMREGKSLLHKKQCDLKILCRPQLDIQHEVLIPCRFLCPETIQFFTRTTKFFSKIIGISQHIGNSYIPDI